VKVDTFEGKVTDIKTRYTVIRAANGREAIVPNDKLITERVENLTAADPVVNLTTSITVGYDSNVDQVLQLLCDATKSFPRVLFKPAPSAHLANFAADGLEFTLCFAINDPDNGQLNIRGDVNAAVLQALRAANVQLAYPQRVVHLQRDAV
jgi:small-conductance mechanosensitive channel